MVSSQTSLYRDYIFPEEKLAAHPVKIGDIPLGGDSPVRIQSMTNTSTNKTEVTASQAIELYTAGADYVRITARGEREAYKLSEIKSIINEQGYNIPLIADIHFSRKAAEVAAGIVEKVRINPGNYADKRATFKKQDIDEKEYREGLERINKNLAPLLEICKNNETALRIGANHGSLSDRIMNRFGDTPEGMVESVAEFLHICHFHNFHDIVISLKSSNTKVMVKANRLMVTRMLEDGIFYPLHLGVTEAGDGEEGRIRSSIGLGALLKDGIGNTIRVSLSENPVNEIPVAQKLLHNCIGESPQKQEQVHYNFDPFAFNGDANRQLPEIPYSNYPYIVADLSHHKKIDSELLKKVGFHFDTELQSWQKGNLAPEFIYAGNISPDIKDLPVQWIIAYKNLSNTQNMSPLFTHAEFMRNNFNLKYRHFVEISYQTIKKYGIEPLIYNTNIILILQDDDFGINGMRSVFGLLNEYNAQKPVILQFKYKTNNNEEFIISSAADSGALFVDNMGDGLMISNSGYTTPSQELSAAFNILQGSGVRITQTEYIACPGCGRTQFNLENTLSKIKEKTAHLKGLKIAVMGCIVNGPGEMADADYGYVGAGKGKITLYKNKNIIKNNIDENIAVEELIKLIKENGDWIEKK